MLNREELINALKESLESKGYVLTQRMLNTFYKANALGGIDRVISCAEAYYLPSDIIEIIGDTFIKF